MAETGAYESDKAECSQNLDQKENNEDSDIEVIFSKLFIPIV